MSQLTLESALEIQELFFHSDAFPPVGGLLYSLNVIVNEVSSPVSRNIQQHKQDFE